MTAAANPDEPARDPVADVTEMVTQWLAQAKDSGALDITPAARCRICRDPSIRELVNAMLSRGFAPITVSEVLEAYNRRQPKNRRITYDVIRRHRAQDYNLQDPVNSAYRALAERHYKAEGGDLDLGIGSIVTVRGFLETMMVKSYQQMMANPETAPDLDQGFKAASKLAEISRKDDDALERAQMVADLNLAIGLMRKYVPVEQWPALQAELRGEELPNQIALPSATPEVRMIEISDEPDAEDP